MVCPQPSHSPEGARLKGHPCISHHSTGGNSGDRATVLGLLVHSPEKTLSALQANLWAPQFFLHPVNYVEQNTTNWLQKSDPRVSETFILQKHCPRGECLGIHLCDSHLRAKRCLSTGPISINRCFRLT